MTRYLASTSFIVALCTVFVTSVFADDFQNARDQIRRGELKQALVSMKQAVVDNPGNKQYEQEFMLLRQMIVTAGQLDSEKNATRWKGNAQRLRTYYEQNGADSLLLDMDRKIYAKSPDTDNAALLAESLIAAGKPTEAAQLLAALPDKSQNSLSKIVYGIAIYHDGKEEEAKKIAAACLAVQAKELLPTPVLFRLAKLEAALNENDDSIDTLKHLFERTPPSGQIVLRERCRATNEFSGLKTGVGFESVLNTPSIVAESACSGGSSCGSCPMRSKCQGR